MELRDGKFQREPNWITNVIINNKVKQQYYMRGEKYVPVPMEAQQIPYGLP